MAGGSGLNTVVVVNETSADSCELGNYYRIERGVPPENILRISWMGGRVEWTFADFASRLRDPLLTFLSEASLTNRIQFVVLSMDIPYRIAGTRANSTTAALFYGYKTNAIALANSYAKSEGRFPADQPNVAPGYSFLTMMLTAGSLEQAKGIVDQGVASDGAAPTSTAWLAKSADPRRNVRFWLFDNAVFNTRLTGSFSLGRTNLSSPYGLTNLLGFQTGTDSLSALPDTFVPGAVADSLTSFGGQLFESSGQTNLLALIHAGASASYGAVVEPQAVVQKFPNPLVYFYQARGFTIAESYYQSIEIPVEGLLVGEPLAAPFRRQCSGGWKGLAEGVLFSGQTNITLDFRANWPGGGIDTVDLFANGRFFETLTNIPPQPGNRLTTRLNGYEVGYNVPTNATLKSVAAEYAALLNSPPHTNFTRVSARAFGDRIELQSLASNLPAGTFEFVDQHAVDGVPRVYLASANQSWTPPEVSGLGWNAAGEFRLRLRNSTGTPAVLWASTNFFDWLALFTNSPGGEMDFADPAAPAYPQRFYRLSVGAHAVPPSLMPSGFEPDGIFGLVVTAPLGRPYLIQASADLMNWTDVLTNQLGGSTVFGDARSAAKPEQFYRTRSADPNDYPAVTVTAFPGGGNLVRVQQIHPADSVVCVSTNGVDWQPIFHHGAATAIKTEVERERGAADLLTTGIRVAQEDFLLSSACGSRKCSLTATNLALFGGTIRLVAILTNGAEIIVEADNPVGNSSLKTLVQLLAQVVNGREELVGNDGFVLEDVVDGVIGAVNFTLRARSPGLEAAAIQVAFETSTNLTPNFLGATALDGNLDDLRPRNHLYVYGGLPSVSLNFALDTTRLPDGYNELCAVAYEGTHVNTQTHRKLSVVVRNTPLEAQMELLGGTTPLTITNTLEVAVSANTNTVSEILLYGTGGFLAGATNQSAANLQVSGAMLGAGEHSIYALVTTTNGLRYRTASQSVIVRRP